MGMKS